LSQSEAKDSSPCALVQSEGSEILSATAEPAASPANAPSAASSKTPADDAAFLWLRRSDQLIVSLLILLLLGLLGVQWLRLSRWGIAPIELSSQQPREYYYSLDINSASWVEWAQLDGIGEKLGKRIVADRDERGPFRNADDVGRVKGIGPKVLEKMKPFLKGGTDSIAPSQ
jgi:competence protein ComEA